MSKHSMRVDGCLGAEEFLQRRDALPAWPARRAAGRARARRSGAPSRATCATRRCGRVTSFTARPASSPKQRLHLRPRCRRWSATTRPGTGCCGVVLADERLDHRRRVAAGGVLTGRSCGRPGGGRRAPWRASRTTMPSRSTATITSTSPSRRCDSTAWPERMRCSMRIWSR